MANPLTVDRLRELLAYDPETGVFVWRVSRGRMPAGARAGSVAGHGYVHVMIDGRLYKAHRLAHFHMTGSWPADEIDHEDRQRANNVWGNLRPATHKQNRENESPRKNNTSGFRGVAFRCGKWQAKIVHRGRFINLGGFPCKDDAIEFRMLAEAMLFTHAPS
jgi:hypothetical protein